MLVAAIAALGQRPEAAPRFRHRERPRTLTLLVGDLDTSDAEAAIVLLVAHAFYKAALFMVAGTWTTAPARGT